jgi:hypothetical protein
MLVLCITDIADTTSREWGLLRTGPKFRVAVGLDVVLTSYVHYRLTSVCNFFFRYRKVLILQLVILLFIDALQNVKINYCRSKMCRVFKSLQSRYVQTLLVSTFKNNAGYLYGSSPVMMTTTLRRTQHRFI